MFRFLIRTYRKHAANIGKKRIGSKFFWEKMQQMVKKSIF